MQKRCSHQHRTLSRRFPLYIDYGLYNWCTYAETDITVKQLQNGQKWNVSYSCQKWTWVLCQAPITRLQCYLSQNAMSRPWSQIATNHKLWRYCRNLWLSQFVTVHNATFQNDVNCAIRYTSKCRKDVHINSGPYQEGFLCTSIIGFITDIHTKRCTSEIAPKSANMNLFIFMSNVNMGTLPSTHNTFSVLLESICQVTALVTNCDKSQIATIVSQFVTVSICDGSDATFQNDANCARRYTPKCRKDVHINIGPYQEGFLCSSILGFITDIHTHK